MAKKPIEEQIVTYWNDLVFEVERGPNRKFKWKITLGHTKHFGVLYDGEYVHLLKNYAVEEVQRLLEHSVKLSGQKVPAGMTISQIIVDLNAFGVVRTGEFHLKAAEVAPTEDSVAEADAESKEDSADTKPIGRIGIGTQIERAGSTEERIKKHASKQPRSKRVGGFSPRR